MITIPACQGCAIQLRVGQALRVINTHGNQVLDTWAFNAEDLEEHMDMAHTRSLNSRIFVRAGDGLMTQRRRPILVLEEDTSPGRHDILLCACNRWIYRELGVTAPHRSCADNLHEALATLGLALTHTPAPLNLFMNVPVAADGTLDRVPPVSQPGDHVVLRAMLDAIVVLSACPQDITAINGGAPRAAAMEIVA